LKNRRLKARIFSVVQSPYAITRGDFLSIVFAENGAAGARGARPDRRSGQICFNPDEGGNFYRPGKHMFTAHPLQQDSDEAAGKAGKDLL